MQKKIQFAFVQLGHWAFLNSLLKAHFFPNL